LIPTHFCVGKGRIHTWEALLGSKVLGPYRSLKPFDLNWKLQRIGIFLDISAKQLSFYNAHKKPALYTVTVADGSSQEGKVLPFCSTCLAAAKPGTEPLKIGQCFDGDDSFTRCCEGL